MIQGDLVYGDRVLIRSQPAKVIHVEHDWCAEPPKISWIEVRFDEWQTDEKSGRPYLKDRLYDCSGTLSFVRRVAQKS